MERAGVDGKAEGRQSHWRMAGRVAGGKWPGRCGEQRESAREERNCLKLGARGRNRRGLPSPAYGRRAVRREGERIYSQWQFRD